MSLKFQTGAAVRQIVAHVIEGVVIDAQVIDGELHHLVEWVGAEGHVCSRWFHESQIEAVV